MPEPAAIHVDLGFATLVAEKDEYDGYKEIVIGLQDKNGNYFQDLALVGNQTVVNQNQVKQVDNETVACVRADVFSEDYTNKYVVPMYDEHAQEA